MRKKYFETLFFVFVLILSSYCSSKEENSGLCITTFCPKDESAICGRRCPNEMWRCNKDEDCVAVPNDCCKYHYYFLAVNKDYAETYEQWRNEECTNSHTTYCYDHCPYMPECKNPIQLQCVSGGCIQGYSTKEWNDCFQKCSSADAPDSITDGGSEIYD